MPLIRLRRDQLQLFQVVADQVQERSPDDQDIQDIAEAIRAAQAGELTQDILDEANSILQRDYFNDVRGIVEEAKEAVKDEEITDDESATEWLDQRLDGTNRIIFTAQAWQVLIHSSNDAAYAEQFGELPVSDGVLDISAMAYMAMREDVIEHGFFDTVNEALEAQEE